eukprot:3677157-Pleurochrysis_carterae.AAC.1
MLIANTVASRISLIADKRPAPLPSPPPGERADTATTNSRTLPSRDEEIVTTTTTRPAPATDDTDASDHELHQHFQRGLGAYPFRNRTPAALLTVRNPRAVPSTEHI